MTVDNTHYMMEKISKEAILSELAMGKVGGLGYDDENIVQMACEMDAEFLDLVLTKLEALGENLNDYAHRADKEGYCAVQLFRSHPEIVEVFRKHNINLEYTRLCPMPWSDVYELFVERKLIKNMKELAQKWHKGKFRKDGVTPYIEHPKKVAQKMLSWMFCPESNGWAVAVVWGHDLIEETPLEKRDELEDEIEWANPGLLREGEHVLKAIRLLTWDEKLIPNKAEYIKHIAGTAEFSVLAVKIADRLCNTVDFHSLEGAGIQKARSYFAAGEPLFEALKTIQTKASDLDKKKIAMILADIEAVRSQLAAPTDPILNFNT